MSATDTDSYYCEICNEQFDIHSLYACFQGHFFCKSCFKQEYYKGKEKRCPHLTCNAWIDNAHVPRSHGEPARISNKMFPQPALYSRAKNISSDTDVTNPFISNSSLTSTSKKPLRCPFKNCNRSIAVTSLDSHFQYEHKHVAFVDTALEARNGLDFHYNDVKLNEILCIVVIKIQDTDNLPRVSSNSDSLKSSPITPQPILVAMASKVSFAHNEDNFGRQSLDAEEEYCNNCVCFPPDEKMIVWIASNITTKFSYTLALSTECSPIRLKYYGPLLSINENHEKLCLEGKGLILNKHQIMKLTENGMKPMSLDILIHCAEEVPNNNKFCE